MSCRLNIRGRGAILLLVLATLAPRLSGARNAAAWEFLEMPAVGEVGQAIQFSAAVTNTGDTPWVIDYFVELRAPGHTPAHVSLATTPPGARRQLALALRLPDVPGTYTYQFATQQYGTEYFGPVQVRTIEVRDSALRVALSLEESEIRLGETVRVRSTAVSGGAVGVHGLQVRPPDGRWETRVEWPGAGGGERSSTFRPAVAGIHELRAYAAQHAGVPPAYSAALRLVVHAVTPVIAVQPADTIVNAGAAVALAVAATGSNLSYQWTKDRVPLAGATRSTLTLAPAQVGQSGSYRVAVSNSAGAVESRAAAVVINLRGLPAVGVATWHFPAEGGRSAGRPGSARVGDVVSLTSTANLTAGAGWAHRVLVRRPAITPAIAMPPEDGSGLGEARAAWNIDGWGRPHADGIRLEPRAAGGAAIDLGQREPFVHRLNPGQAESTRSFDLVLDAPGAWLFQADVIDQDGHAVAVSPPTAVEVSPPALATEPETFTYPYGRTDRFVGVYWNAGQAHRLGSTWRAAYPQAYRANWSVNWRLMWQPSPYFRTSAAGWLTPLPSPDSPWQPFWSAHEVYAIVPDEAGMGRLTHDLTSLAFAEKAALRLMDIGVDFAAIDYTNMFLEEREDTLTAMGNLAQAFQDVAARVPSGQRVRLTAVVPANVTSGAWQAQGGFGAGAIARFNAKLTTLFQRFAQFEPAWFHLEDDNGRRKPLLLLWIGASGEEGPGGRLPSDKLGQLRLADGRSLADVFTVRWVGAYLGENPWFQTGGTYTVNSPDGPVSGRYANAKIWSYHEHFPAAASVMPGATGTPPAVEAVTVQPLAAGRDRFGRRWETHWPVGRTLHYETPGSLEPVPLVDYGRIWRRGLAAARELNPRFLLTTWAEFGSENDEPRPEMSVTIMDNNKFGTHFGDALKQAVRWFKYQAPAAWIDTFGAGGAMRWINQTDGATPPVIRNDQALRLQGWVSPNVATAFADGRVGIYVNDVRVGWATVGGSWQGATRWFFDLEGGTLGPGRHGVKVLVEDGVGGTALAGVQFLGEAVRNTLPIIVAAYPGAPGLDP